MDLKHFVKVGVELRERLGDCDGSIGSVRHFSWYLHFSYTSTGTYTSFTLQLELRGSNIKHPLLQTQPNYLVFSVEPNNIGPTFSPQRIAQI